MRRQKLHLRMTRVLAFLALAVFVAAPVVQAALPYNPVPVGTIQLGKGIATPKKVFGKEYSHQPDVDITPIIDPEQVIAWDGGGGVLDGLDYTGTRPTWTPDNDVDALANTHDALFSDVIRTPNAIDRAHLIFTVAGQSYAKLPAFGPLVPVPSAGPITIANGNMLGGAGEISYEGAFAFWPASTQAVWATQADVNGMPLPDDVDGLEVWGPEPGTTADSDKYSLRTDILNFGSTIPGDAVSVWNLNGTAYIPLSTVRAAVAGLLGPKPTHLENFNINLDALMVNDDVGEPDDFGRDPAGGPAIDRIIFSIQQIPDPLDPTGFYATGSELFVMTAAGTAVFLDHGGHLWDKAYAAANLTTILPVAGGNLLVQLDVDGIEAIGVPEPASVLLSLVGLAVVVAMRRRK